MMFFDVSYADKLLQLFDDRMVVTLSWKEPQFDETGMTWAAGIASGKCNAQMVAWVQRHIEYWRKKDFVVPLVVESVVLNYSWKGQPSW